MKLAPSRLFLSIAQAKGSSAAILQSSISRVLVLGVGMCTGVITARFLGADGRGELAACNMWPQTLAYISAFGLPSSLLYNLNLQPEDSRRLFGTAVHLSACFGVTAACVGIIFIPSWMSNYSDETIQFARGMLIFTPLILVSLIANIALESNKQFTIANQSRLLIPCVTLALLVVFQYFFGLNYRLASLAYLTPNVPVLAWMFISIHKRISYRIIDFLPSKKSLRLYRLLCGYGIRSYGVELLGTLLIQVGQFWVIGLLTPAQLGLYTVAFSLSRLMNILQGSLISVLNPRISARPLAEVMDVSGKALRASIALLGLLATMLILLAPFILKILYGDEFIEATLIFQVLLAEAVLNSIAWLLTQVFMAVGKPGVVTIVQGVTLAFSVPITFLFIKFFQLEGAAFAFLATTLIRTIATIACFPGMLKMAPPKLIPKLEDLSLIVNRLRALM